MKLQITLSMILVLIVLIIAACAPRQAEAEFPATPVASNSGPVEDQASLIDALRAAGANVEPGEAVEQVFFSVSGQILKVNGADVQIFEYESAAAMETDAAQVAPDGGSIGTSMVTWIATPHFYKSGRLIVLYVGDDTVVLDLLKSVLGGQFAGR